MKKLSPLAVSLALALAAGGLHAEEKAAAGSPKEPGVVDKAEKAVVRGAKATARGIDRGIEAAGKGVARGVTATTKFIEKGANATARGVGRGAKATGDFIERGVNATGNAIDRAAQKLKTTQEPAPVQ